MPAIAHQQDRQTPMPIDCDQCGHCDSGGVEGSPCTRRVPVLLMPAATIERLRAVEMKTLALSQDDVQFIDAPHQLDLNF